MINRNLANFLAVLLLVLPTLLFGAKMASASDDVSAQRGKQLTLVCSGCHTMAADEGHRIGPNLWNISGREIGSAAGYQYSEAMQKFSGKWSSENLNRYLTSPAAFIPNNKMGFAGIKSEADRASVIAYLETLKPGGATVAMSADFDYGGLAQGKGREDVYRVCSACHSVMLVKQQGMSRSRWSELLEWMVEEQGMDELSDTQHELILSYLTEHYGG